jgi:hypothetical protein
MYDCGTYSLHFAKSIDDAKVSIDDYLIHLKKYSKHYEYYSNFDNDFTPHGFIDNQNALRRMESEGLKPFPVVHDYFMREIQIYVDEGYEFLALGCVMTKGSAKKQRTQYHIEHALSQIPTDKVKVHLFGASSYKSIAHLPLYSCDSSSWALNNKFGFVLYWNPFKEGQDKTDKLFFIDKMKDYWNDDRLYWEKYNYRQDLEQYIGSLGFTYDDLMGHEANHYRQLLNAIYYLTIEEIITKKQSEKHLLAA